MDRSTVLQALSSMEQYVVRLRQQDDETKRQVNNLQSEIQSFKQELDRAQHIERDQNLPENDRMTARVDTERCRMNISVKEQALHAAEQQVADLNSRVQSSQRIVDELKIAEGYMHDYEQRAQQWVNEAYKAMQ